MIEKIVLHENLGHLTYLSLLTRRSYLILDVHKRIGPPPMNPFLSLSAQRSCLRSRPFKCSHRESLYGNSPDSFRKKIIHSISIIHPNTLCLPIHMIISCISFVLNLLLSPQENHSNDINLRVHIPYNRKKISIC
jgi:hypothetical protein